MSSFKRRLKPSITIRHCTIVQKSCIRFLSNIGAELARILANRGEEVVLFDIAVNRCRIEDIENKVKIVRGDLGNHSEVPPFPETVKHLPPTFQPHAVFNFIWQLQKQ